MPAEHTGGPGGMVGACHPTEEVKFIVILSWIPRSRLAWGTEDPISNPLPTGEKRPTFIPVKSLKQILVLHVCRNNRVTAIQ